ncbi:phage scaffolding protein [uncultured Ilyobacter sp.]|uniref:phage scaffolding protein n=1 Tax=uncultured Ilyobacter sp. TaxID=544433 RepID=UPI0029C72EF6|nr:phage scaffolding protein [uncultured Ilyobacter sp.]
MKEQVLEFLGKEENKGFLKENGFQTEVEKIVEKPAEITVEAVEGFIGENQGLRDKLYNNHISKYLKKQLGVEEVTPEMLGEKITFAKNIDTFKGKAIETALKLALKGAKHPELILGQVDKSKINFGDEGLTGIDEQVTGLKEKYPELFGEKKPTTPGTPPALPKGTKQKKSKEEINAMPMTERLAYKKANPDWYK